VLYGVLGDLHGPWIDERAVNLALDIFEDVGVTHLILNGDVLDFYNINAHGPKDPGVQTNLEDEIHWGYEFLNDLVKRFKNTEIVFIFGNHEYRLDRFIMANCPAFMNFLKLEKMLRLDELGIKWLPYNERYQVGKTNLYIQHSPPSYSANSMATTSLMKKMDTDHIWNCAHRTDMSVKTGSSGRVYTSYVNGWFGSTGIIKQNQNEMPENRRVFMYTKNHEQWNTSFCLVSVQGKQHHVQQVLMKNYVCALGETIYEG